MAELDWAEEKLNPRVTRNFFLRYRIHQTDESFISDDGEIKSRPNWEATVNKAINKEGCYFFSNLAYRIGDMLDVQVTIPSLATPIQFLCEVKHCKEVLYQNSPIFAIGVFFLGCEGNKKDEFEQALDFFLLKQSRDNL